MAKNLLGRLKSLGAVELPQAAGAIDLLSIEIDLLAGVVPSSASSIDIAKATSRAEVLTQAQALMAPTEFRLCQTGCSPG